MDSGQELCPPTETRSLREGGEGVGPDQLSDPKIPGRNTATREEKQLQETWVTLQVILYFLII